MELKLTRISITLLIASLFFTSVANAQNVYRWTDENGDVHYGPTLPPEFANKPYEILNRNGVLLQRVDDPSALLEKPEEVKEESQELEPLFTEQEVRTRSDSLLLLRYPEEADLTAAMENEVAQLGYDIRLINQSRASALTTLATQVGNAADRQRAGMPEDPDLRKEIGSLRNRLGSSEGRLMDLRERELAIRAEFESDLKRYRYLTNGGQPGGSEDS
jgi:hypothetical protein